MSASFPSHETQTFSHFIFNLQRCICLRKCNCFFPAISLMKEIDATSDSQSVHFHSTTYIQTFVYHHQRLQKIFCWCLPILYRKKRYIYISSKNETSILRSLKHLLVASFYTNFQLVKSYILDKTTIRTEGKKETIDAYERQWSTYKPMDR
jgi:hypothetical protein